MRFTDPRVQALLNVCGALALLPAGFTNRDLRHHLAPPPGLTPTGLTHALSLTHLAQRFLIPGISQITDLAHRAHLAA
ncbi:MAG: hypothetical protein HY241_07320 [Actinobacteria bacterium]|nr:hypothetical protein [Actinomycetota bacterium]